MTGPITDVATVNGAPLSAQRLAQALWVRAEPGVRWEEAHPEDRKQFFQHASDVLGVINEIQPAPAAFWYAGELPTFAEMHAETTRLVQEACDTARSDWLSGTGPTRAQVDAWQEAKHHLSRARGLLDQV